MGERVGSMLTRSQNLFLIIGVGFLLGFLITISEPDLQVLANQVPSIPNMTLILSVAAGVGIFLVMAFLRMLLGIPLPRLLVIFYAAIFLLAAFVPKEFLAVAFDSGGVTTGPMTVPFIMALGVGVSAIRSDRHAADDSFGLVALCSVGPILAVLILGIVFNASESSYVPPVIPEVGDSVELWQLFSEGLPTYLHEIATSLLPIVVMFGIFQLAALHIDRRTLGRIGVGLVYTYIGLVLFLTGANIGFMPAGNYLGQVLGGQSSRWLLIPIGMLIGYFIVRAEPAVYVLNKQVEEVTDGAISAGTMGAALSAGVALSVGLAMVRVLNLESGLLCGDNAYFLHVDLLLNVNAILAGAGGRKTSCGQCFRRLSGGMRRGSADLVDCALHIVPRCDDNAAVGFDLLIEVGAAGAPADDKQHVVMRALLREGE